MKNSTRIAFIVLAGSTAALSNAGSIIANYTFDLMQQVSVDYLGTPYSPNAARIQGVRTGGTTTLLPGPPYAFNTYCVELGQTINGGGQTHPNVTPLLGSVTNTGGITGPVLFDATRTDQLERLWGSFFPWIGNSQLNSSAFQLAQWEITFDNDLSLTSGVFQSGDAVAGLAQALLNDVATGAANINQKLLLLSGPDIQDQVTPVPEPGTMLALGLGATAFLRRRKR